MTNPFDEFDNEQTTSTRHLPPSTGPKQPVANPFDEFDDPDLYGPPTNPDNVPRQYQPWEIAPELMRNLGPDAVSVLGGMWQSLIHWPDTVAGAGRILSGAALNMAGDEHKQRVLKQDPRMQERIDAANAVGEQITNFLNNPVGTTVEHPAHVGLGVATAVAPFNGAIRAGANALRVPEAAQHAAAIALNPTRAVEGPIQAAGRVTRAGWDAAHPQQNFLLRKTEGQAQQTANALNNPQVHVPGSNPTSPQVIADMPNPPIQAQILMKDAARLRPTQNRTALTDQNTAQFNAIDAVVPHRDLPAAIAARDAQAAQDYANAGVVLNPNNPPPIPVANVMVPETAFMHLYDRPAMNTVRDRAREVAANFGRDFQIGTTTPGGPAPTGLVGPNGQPLMQNVPPTVAQIPAQSVHFMKLALDDVIKDPERFGIGATEVTALRGIREEVINQLESHNPAYGVARRNFAAASRPIDQTTLLNYYREKLANPVKGEDAAKLNAQAFMAARSNGLNEALGNTSIRKATGQSRYRHDADLLDPHQTQALDAIGADRARAALAEEQMNTPSSYAGEISASSQAAQAPGWMNVHVTVANALSRMLTGRANNRVANALADTVDDPQALAALIQQAIEYEAQTNRMSEHARRVGRAGQAINRVPAVYNALEAEREQRNRYIP